jgi:phage portal protein BeeE
MSPGLGMSWITPALRDIQADQSALEHKLAYFSNGATPNLVIKGLPAVTSQQFKDAVNDLETAHKGSVNAFKTLYLSAGADATVVGSNLAELDLSSITSHGETRVSYLSRVPAVILGIAAGLKGSSLNAGNYAEARRNFADSWVYPTLANLCSALSVLINVPGGAELWFDVADIPLLREDALDAANIERVKEETIVAYVQAGFKPDSVIAAVRGQDISQLVHDDRFTSVQLQVLANAGKPSTSPNGSANGEAPQNGSAPKEPTAPATPAKES